MKDIYEVFQNHGCFWYNIHFSADLIFSLRAL